MPSITHATYDLKNGFGARPNHPPMINSGRITYNNNFSVRAILAVMLGGGIHVKRMWQKQSLSLSLFHSFPVRTSFGANV